MSRWVTDQRGASSLASVFGVAIFLGFLLLASQVMVHLYAASTVSAVAFDNARRAAVAGGDCSRTEAQARASLGGWGADPSQVSITCQEQDGVTTVRITGPSPSAALRMYGELAGHASIDRGASVRTAAP